MTVPENTDGVFAERGGRDSPRRATSFLVRDKKGGADTRPTVCGSCWANLRRGACGVRRGTHCAPAALRSDNHGESVDEACALRRACHPTSTPTQAQPERGGEAPYGPSLRLAWHARRVAPAPLGAERSDGPCGCWTPIPSVCACGAQGMADQGSRLFERRRREFERDPAITEHRRLPAAQRRDADSRVAFLLGTFLWRSKE